MIDEFDSLLAEPAPAEAPGPTNVERALAMLPTIVELGKQGKSRLAICKQLGLRYEMICKEAKRNPVLYNALKGIPTDEKTVQQRVPMEDPAEPQNLKKIQEWSRDGVSRASQAALLRMTEEQFEGYVKNVFAVAEAIRIGEAEREATACAALSALARDPDHKDHVRAVMAMIDRAAASVKANQEEASKAPLSPDQIRDALRAP